MAKLQKNLFRDLTCTRQNDNTKLYHLRRVGVLVPPPEKRKVVPRSVLMASERQSRTEIVRLGKLMHSCGFVAGMDGNLSVRIDANRLLVTPTAMSKGAMRASDLVIVDLQGRKLQGRRNVSSEIGMHLLIYKLRPDIRAIVHAHPPRPPGLPPREWRLRSPSSVSWSSDWDVFRSRVMVRREHGSSPTHSNRSSAIMTLSSWQTMGWLPTRKTCSTPT